jgi:multidrug transporter EmrE-like cation transporter
MRHIYVLTLIVFTVGVNTAAQIGLKLSAGSHNVRAFLAWQVFGNLAGFLGVLGLTGLLRLIPLHVAYPVTVGLGVVAVTIAAAFVFREHIGMHQWAGALLVVAGIALITN